MGYSTPRKRRETPRFDRIDSRKSDVFGFRGRLLKRSVGALKLRHSDLVSRC